MRLTVEIARDPRYWRPRTSDASGFKDFINHSGNTEVRIIWFKARNGVQYVANNKDGGLDCGDITSEQATNNPSANKALFNNWFEDGVVSTTSTIYGTANTAM